MSQFPDPVTGQPNPFAASPGSFPPPKKSNIWLWILLGAGGAGVLVCCGCGGLGYFGFSKAMNLVGDVMKQKLNEDATAQQHLGKVNSVTFDVMGSGEATQKAGGKNVMLFHAVGEKSKGDVIADQAPGNQAFQNARLILPSGEEVQLGF